VFSHLVDSPSKRGVSCIEAQFRHVGSCCERALLTKLNGGVPNHAPSMPHHFRVQAPVRVADVGGWTDTWFSVSGAVCNVAVGPAVQVEIETEPETQRAQPAVLHLPDFGRFTPLSAEGLSSVAGEHPVLGEILRRYLHPTVASITISSLVPPGSSLGTSGSVGVALVAGLFAVAQLGSDPQAIAEAAHAAETAAGLESGVQDHAAAAFGGACLVEVNYPEFAVRRLVLQPATQEALTQRLRTVFLGRHNSSAIHRMVIDRVAPHGRTGDAGEFGGLRLAARDAADALEANDLHTYGLAMDESVHLQRSLHPRLVSPAAERLVSLGTHFGGHAKVNGAGGDGGSVTLLAPDDDSRRVVFDHALAQLVEQLPGASLVNLGYAASGATCTVNGSR
jgi:D-glycero-alpha-D-manno-heptose-7-phosphate kinase